MTTKTGLVVQRLLGLGHTVVEIIERLKDEVDDLVLVKALQDNGVPVVFFSPTIYFMPDRRFGNPEQRAQCERWPISTFTSYNLV